MSTNAEHPSTDSTGEMHVQILLDRSGSMRPIAAATVDAINGFLAKQRKQPGVLRLSLIDFESSEPFRIVADAIPIAEMTDLGPDDFRPAGGTPLFDAIGLGIERCAARVEANGEEDQLVVILTDGAENASTDFTGEQIAELIEAKQEAGWTFLFLGANQDSFATGNGLRMRSGNVRDFRADADGIRSAVALASEAVTVQRGRTRSERAARRDTLFDETDPQA